MCDALRYTKMALDSYSHIGFATEAVLYILGGLGYTPYVCRLEL